MRRVEPSEDERVVITGIGLVTSVGLDRETVWQAVQQGHSTIRPLRGFSPIPDDLLLAARVELPADDEPGYKSFQMTMRAAAEALDDAGIHPMLVDRERFGCAISAQFGDCSYIPATYGRPELQPNGNPDWFDQFLPNTACSLVANHYGLLGPRMCHTAACASGLIEVISAARRVREGSCDLALAGSADTLDPLVASGFQAMRVLAQHADPRAACRPFDRQRSGFVIGEGAALFVLERLSHARDRGAPIYAEIVGSALRSEALHVTAFDADQSSLPQAVSSALRQAGVEPSQIDYVSAHGTGTLQNDVAETRGLRRSLGRAVERIPVSSVKAMLGHCVNAAGSVELALTALALRDGFAPPTLNLTDPDPECDLDYVPLVGRAQGLEHALKVSLAFGGHVAALVLRRADEAQARPLVAARRAAA